MCSRAAIAHQRVEPSLRWKYTVPRLFLFRALPCCHNRPPSLTGDDGKTRYKFSEGAVTIKEVINKSFWGIFNTAGLLAQFKVVGTWDAFPIDALPDTPSSSKASSE